MAAAEEAADELRHIVEYAFRLKLLCRLLLSAEVPLGGNVAAEKAVDELRHTIERAATLKLLCRHPLLGGQVPLDKAVEEFGEELGHAVERPVVLELLCRRPLPRGRAALVVGLAVAVARVTRPSSDETLEHHVPKLLSRHRSVGGEVPFRQKVVVLGAFVASCQASKRAASARDAAHNIIQFTERAAHEVRHTTERAILASLATLASLSALVTLGAVAALVAVVTFVALGPLVFLSPLAHLGGGEVGQEVVRLPCAEGDVNLAPDQLLQSGDITTAQVRRNGLGRGGEAAAREAQG